MSYDIHELKPLTLQQYETVKRQVVDIIRHKIGDKPKRDDFKRDYGSLLDIRSGFVFVVFLSALVVSSIHILDYVALSTTAPLPDNEMSISLTTNIGFHLDKDTKMKLQQIGFIVLSEFSMLLFMVFWQTERKTRPFVDSANLSKFQKTTAFIDNNKFLFLALLSMVYVVIANWNTVSNKIMAIMPPASTIAIGFYIESIISELLVRRREIDKKYTSALDIWHKQIEDITRHPDYVYTLRGAIWTKLASLKANSDFVDAPKAFKFLAVYNEMERDNWTRDDSIVQELKTSKKTTLKATAKDRQDVSRSSGYTRNSDAKDIARQWLLDNPDKFNLPLRTLEDMIEGASRSTISNVRNELLDS